MQMHQRKKIEITIADAYVEKVSAILEGEGVKGFTVFRAEGGRGSSGAWRNDPVTRAEQHTLVSAVMPEESAARVLEALARLFQRYHGIAVVSDVTVMRAEKF